MKGKKYRTEEKIRILREADTGECTIAELCKEKNISEVTFHRWKREFGMMEVNEAKRLKELERENTELKKMLADSLLENRVLRFVNEKNYEPGAQEKDGAGGDRRAPVLRAQGMPVPATGASHLVVSGRAAQRTPTAIGRPCPRAFGATSPLRLSPDRCDAAGRGLACGQAPGATAATSGRPTGATNQTQAGAAWALDGATDQGDAPWARLDVGLHRGCHRAGRRAADAHGAR